MQEQIETLYGMAPKPKRKRRPRKAMAPVFKRLELDEPVFFPETLDSRIGQSDVARFIQKVINQLDCQELYAKYQGGGTSAYDPVMLLKVLILAYVKKIYTSRKIAQALRENIAFMWISGKSTPDFRTIAEFRSGRLKEVIEKLFAGMVQLLIKEGYISLEAFFIDGTKLRADANKYSAVWKKNAERYKKGVEERIKELLKEIEAEEKQENDRCGENDLEEVGPGKEITSDYVRELLKGLKAEQEEQKAKGQENSEAQKQIKKHARCLKKIEEKELPKLEKYERQQQVAGQRSGYSKTDEDASMHRWKDGQVLPSYNAMITTSNQYVVQVTIGQNPSDASLFIPHMQRYASLHVSRPGALVGDAGFGSEENYKYLENTQIANYLKFNTFYREAERIKKSPYAKENFTYNEGKDQFVCPQGRNVPFVEERVEKKKSGFESVLRYYRCVDCTGCPVAKDCKKGEGGRMIVVNRELERYKQQARDNLTSDIGKDFRKRRNTEPETFNGDMKHNQGFRRVHLRGVKKVEAETTLVAFAHNFKKMSLNPIQKISAHS